MQPSIKRSATSDDEEDLESLRLAALQSLKRQAQPTSNGLPPVPIAPKLCNPKLFGGLKSLNKRGRGFHGGPRMPRNGPYNNRMRNTNLISVQTIEPDQSHDSLADINRNKKFTEESIPKLILPQDRYCNTKASAESKVFEASSKFDRYNDSDNSDSDSESEDEKSSETESPRKLERANSLEALMQELENEIHGELKPSLEATSKPKRAKKSRKCKPETTDKDSEVALLESSDELCASETEIKNKTESVKVESDVKVDVVECSSEKDQAGTSTTEKNDIDIPVRRKSKSPIRPPVLPNPRRPQARSPTENCIPQNLLVNQPIHNLPYMNPNVPIAAPVIPFQPPYANFNVPRGHPVPFDAPLPYTYPTAPPMGGPNGMHSPPRQMFSPNRYERPISPLSIKTDILNTISAPLSPRSAAFVLQNREIIERRKKSPRRSYSRSPSPEFLWRSSSPRYRRSNSRPSRSPSPIRQRHSPNRRASPLRRISPGGRRLSPNNRRISPNSQPSSRRSSPNANRYRLSPPKRPSPSGRMSPKRSHRSPQRNSVRNRLGLQSTNKPEAAVSDNEREGKTRKRSRSISLSLSPSPERFSRKSSPINEEDKSEQVDPVLEARKRKFEAGTVPTEGIIRLKPKVNSEEEASETKDDDEEKIESEADFVDEELNEEELLGGDDTYIDFNVKVDDLFSDEESDNENEGRFKSNRQQTPRDVTVVPFTQLVNGPNKPKNETASKDKRPYDRERDRRDRNRSKADRDKNPSARSRNSPDRSRFKDERERERTRARPNDRQRSRSPLRVQSRDSAANNVVSKNEGPSKGAVSSSSVKSSTETLKKESGAVEKRPLKNNSVLKDRKRPPIVSPIENKKIEIKIRNPSKYEVESRSYDVANKDEELVKEKKPSARKVEVANDAFTNNEMEDEDFDEPEPEIIIENEEGEDEDVINKNEDAGDLRAQLSRKRAERQNKLPKGEGVPSRLLQNALQGAVFKKSKKSKSKKKDKEAAPLDHVDASIYAAVRRTTAKTGYGVVEINNSTASKDRKVRVLHCDAEPLTTASDGKLPIHLRLGIPGAMDIFTDTKAHKISRKRSKNRGNFDQV